MSVELLLVALLTSRAPHAAIGGGVLGVEQVALKNASGLKPM